MLRWSFHDNLYLSSTIHSIANMVWFILFVRSFVWGWEKVVHKLLLPKRFDRCLNSLFSNFPPWSGSSFYGIMKRMIKSLKKCFVTVLAFFLQVGYVCVYLVKWSVNYRMYSNRSLDFSRFKKSIPTISKGEDDVIDSSGALPWCVVSYVEHKWNGSL